MVTIISNFTSGKFYPSTNPINITVNSNNNGNCNFRYICDVYVNNIKVFTDKLFPDPLTGYGFFQISRVLQDYISTYQTVNQTSIIGVAAETATPTGAINVYCKFGEEYDISNDCTGDVIQYPNLVTSNAFKVYEASIDYEDFPSYTDSTYLMGHSATPVNIKFLTNSPRTIELTYNDSFYLDFITNYPINNSWDVVFEIQRLDGTLTSTMQAITLPDIKRYRIAVGPFDINNLMNDTVIGMNVLSYNVFLRYNNVRQSEIFYFKVKEPKCFQTRIGFTGLKGGLEHFTFYHRNTTSFNIDRKNYDRSLGHNVSGEWKYNVGDRGTTTYKVNANEVHTVASYCEKSVSEWLYEMWLSPEVWTYNRPLVNNARFMTATNTYPSSNSTKILIYIDNIEDYNVGDYIFILPEYIYGFTGLAGRKQIISITGNLVDVGITYLTCNLPKQLIGYIYKDTTVERLPIVISDNTIQVKQKTTKPVEYTLNYQMAYLKNTIRG